MWWSRASSIFDNGTWVCCHNFLLTLIVLVIPPRSSCFLRDTLEISAMFHIYIVQCETQRIFLGWILHPRYDCRSEHLRPESLRPRTACIQITVCPSTSVPGAWQYVVFNYASTSIPLHPATPYTSSTLSLSSAAKQSYNSPTISALTLRRTQPMGTSV